MQYYSGRMNDIKMLELTRHQSFVDGRMDMFDVLAAQKQTNEQIEYLTKKNVLTVKR